VLLVPALHPGQLRAAEPPSCELDGIDRVVAVGDVHGAADRLVEILKTAGLVDGRGRWTGGRAHLVQTGDVVDRGPDSRKALDFLRRLQMDAARAGGGVHLLLGNHEVMRMLGDLRFTTPGEYEAFTSADSIRMRDRFVELAKPDEREQLRKETPPGLLEMRAAFGRDGSYGQWLRSWPVVVRINGVLFLHGGISPAVASLGCAEINARVVKELGADFDTTRAGPLSSLAASEDGPLWYRGLAQQPDTFAGAVDDILARQRARAIVIGHTVVPDTRIRSRFGGKVIQIDTGMQPAYVPSGRASALEIRGGDVTAIYTDRREPLSAPPAPAAAGAAPPPRG
jgi:calcineurin-like phosphoesterase family protein